MKKTKIISIILGGGQGSRLYPLTRQRAKPAVPLFGKYRLIDIPLSNCINSGFNHIFVLTQFMSASLHRHIYTTYKFDAFSKGYVELLPAEQTLTSSAWYQGTADAVRKQIRHFKRSGAEDAVILAGDHLYRMDYRKFYRFHKEKNADVTFGVARIKSQDLNRFGIMKIDDEYKIKDYCEKPQSNDDIEGFEINHESGFNYYGSMGIFIFKMKALMELLDEVEGVDFGPHVCPAAVHTRQSFGYIFDGYWEDIGTIRSFYLANLALTRLEPPFDFYDPDNPIYTRSRFLPPSQIEDSRITSSVVTEGCWLVQSEISNSVVGLRSILRPGSQLKNVVMMGADFYETEDELKTNNSRNIPHVGIGDNSIVEGAIIDKNVRIGKNVVISPKDRNLCHETEHYMIHDGIVVIPKNTLILDNTRI